MVDVSLILLSKTNSELVYNMTKACIDSFIQSAHVANKSYEIIVVESEIKSTYFEGDTSINIIKPIEEFNFHAFLNIGVKKANSNYYILSNNDIVFNENWLLETFTVIKNNSTIKSFSPYDVLSNKLDKKSIDNHSYIEGYEIQKHIAGWCIVMHKSVYRTIKGLDEQFHFYYADNDYAMQLQKFNVKHALVTNAKVTHLEAQSSNSNKASNFKRPKGTPQYIIKENWTWVLGNEKMIKGLIQFHNKYGSRKVIKLKLLICNALESINLGYLKRYII